MSILGVVLGIIIIVFALIFSKFLVDLLIPESHFEEIEAIGDRAREELKRRGVTEE